MVKKRITQALVAERAGVSQTAVSQILADLDNESSFRLETRQRVLQAAQELGYVPSIAARALRTNRTMTIGVILSLITDELALRITQGIQDVALQRGYGILIADSEQNPELELGILKHFREREVDGLIFVDSWRNPETLLDNDLYPPMIFAQLRPHLGKSNCVGTDNFRGGYTVTRHLLELGRRKIAHISGPEGWESGIARKEGYRKALEDYHIPYDPTLIVPGDWTIRSGVEATLHLLDKHPDIDAIFVSNDLMAAGSIQAAAGRGLHIPHDIALVGYDDRYLSEALLPPLSSFSIPLHAIGQKAAYLLIDQLLSEDARHVPSTSVDGSLVIRASCGA